MWSTSLYSPAFYRFLPVGYVQQFSSAPSSQTPSLCVPQLMPDTKFHTHARAHTYTHTHTHIYGVCILNFTCLLCKTRRIKVEGKPKIGRNFETSVS
jgi:hypothetical protein